MGVVQSGAVEEHQDWRWPVDSSAISVAMISWRALDHTLSTIIVVSGHKSLPELSQVKAVQRGVDVLRRSFCQSGHHLPELSKTIGHNLWTTAALVQPPFSGQCLSRAGIQTLPALVAEFFREWSIGFEFGACQHTGQPDCRAKFPGDEQVVLTIGSHSGSHCRTPPADFPLQTKFGLSHIHWKKCRRCYSFISLLVQKPLNSFCHLGNLLICISSFQLHDLGIGRS
jgi:hypothetical protein